MKKKYYRKPPLYNNQHKSQKSSLFVKLGAKLNSAGMNIYLKKEILIKHNLYTKHENY